MNLKPLLLAALLAFSACVGVSQAQTAKPFVVVIDPGHPSETAAGAAANGLSENRINWQVAQRLGARLSKLGITTYITKRRENEKVTNRKRAEMVE